MVAARTVGGFSGASVSVALVVEPVIDVPGTCSVVVVVIWTSSVAAVSVSEVLLRVVLLPGGGAVPTRTFLFINKLLVLSLRFLFVEILNSWFSGFRSSSSEYSISSLSPSIMSKTRVVFVSISSVNGSVSNFGLCT